MGLITPLQTGRATSTVAGTTASDYVDLAKDADGFPLVRVYGDGKLAIKGAKVVRL